METNDKKRRNAEERRQAILDAALEVFSDQGFAAARLDDVAQKAGVAKGTLYLYFPDKEALFEELLLSIGKPIIEQFRAIAAGPPHDSRIVLSRILQVIQADIIGSGRERLLRLVISEAPRFPRIAEFYYREIVSQGRELIRAIATQGVEHNELPSDALARFPQLFMAPVLVAIIWEALFSRFDKLDVPAMFDEHRKIMLGINPDKDSSWGE